MASFAEQDQFVRHPGLAVSPVRVAIYVRQPQRERA